METSDFNYIFVSNFLFLFSTFSVLLELLKYLDEAAGCSLVILDDKYVTPRFSKRKRKKLHSIRTLFHNKVDLKPFTQKYEFLGNCLVKAKTNSASMRVSRIRTRKFASDLWDRTSSG